jgi:hypothetical protein
MASEMKSAMSDLSSSILRLSPRTTVGSDIFNLPLPRLAIVTNQLLRITLWGAEPL